MPKKNPQAKVENPVDTWTDDGFVSWGGGLGWPSNFFWLGHFVDS